MDRGWSRPGRVADGRRRPRCPVATAGPSVSPGLEQAGLGLDEGCGGVDLVPLGPEPAGPIGPAQALRGVVQLRCRDEQGLPERQIRRALGHRNAVVGRGEADPLELAVDLGQDVGPREGGPALGDLADGHAGGVGEDLVGQVPGAQQRQIVAVRQPRYPGLRISSDVELGAVAPPSVIVARGRCSLSGRVSSVACCRSLMISVVVGGRPWAATKAGIRRLFAFLDGRGALGELGQQVLGNPGHLEADLVRMSA